MTKDIFDFSDTSDLPNDLQTALTNRKRQSGGGQRSKYVKVLERAPGPLSAAEVRAALYRETGIAPTRAATTAALVWLKRGGLARQPERGLWEAVKKS